MKRRSDEEISAPLYAFDAEVRSPSGCSAGVAEAGRGALCGPAGPAGGKTAGPAAAGAWPHARQH